jgi:hypothetical protein
MLVFLVLSELVGVGEGEGESEIWKWMRLEEGVMEVVRTKEVAAVVVEVEQAVNQ